MVENFYGKDSQEEIDDDDEICFVDEESGAYLEIAYAVL